MDLQCYRNFIAIVEEGSLTAASQRLHIAQPALSNQLKAMEREYGASLLIRGARRVSLTDGGRIWTALEGWPAPCGWGSPSPTPCRFWTGCSWSTSERIPR